MKHPIWVVIFVIMLAPIAKAQPVKWYDPDELKIGETNDYCFVNRAHHHAYEGVFQAPKSMCARLRWSLADAISRNDLIGIQNKNQLSDEDNFYVIDSTRILETL